MCGGDGFLWGGASEGEEVVLLKKLFYLGFGIWSSGASVPGLFLLAGLLVSELLQDVVHCCVFLDL